MCVYVCMYVCMHMCVCVHACVYGGCVGEPTRPRGSHVVRIGFGVHVVCKQAVEAAYGEVSDLISTGIAPPVAGCSATSTELNKELTIANNG